MNATQIPTVFAGDTLVEDTSLTTLILRGKQKDVEVFGMAERMCTMTLDSIPSSIAMHLIQGSLKAEPSSIGGIVNGDFLLPDLKNYISVLGHFYFAEGFKSSSMYLSKCSWFYFKIHANKHTDKTLTVAESMEHAIYKAYEEEKKGSVV